MKSFAGEIESRVICPNYCGRSYKRKSEMHRHLRFECGVEPKFKCYICFRKYGRKATLTNHLGFKHNIVSPNIV